MSVMSLPQPVLTVPLIYSNIQPNRWMSCIQANISKAAGAGKSTASSTEVHDQAPGSRVGVPSIARPGDAPLPAPPPAPAPAGGAASGAETLGGNSSGINGVVSSSPRSDMDTPNLMNADWSWDEDTLDAQLFSFLVDAPPPG